MCAMRIPQFLFLLDYIYAPFSKKKFKIYQNHVQYSTDNLYHHKAKGMHPGCCPHRPHINSIWFAQFTHIETM